jgi:hypothetical protein
MVALACCALLLAVASWTVRQVEMRVMLERAMAEQAEAQVLLARDLARDAGCMPPWGSITLAAPHQTK